MKKPRFTLEMHNETAEELHEARRKAMSVFLKVARAYPVNSKAARRARAVLTAVDDLRCELDNCLFVENPGEYDLAGVYYNGG